MSARLIAALSVAFASNIRSASGGIQMSLFLNAINGHRGYDTVKPCLRNYSLGHKLHVLSLPGE